MQENRRGEPVLIVGTGAMACLFAARLSAAGIPVSMLGNWAEGLNALTSQGVQLVDEEGQRQAYPVQAISGARGCPPASYALVLVKSWQTEQAGHQLAQCLLPEGIALTLQNGLGNYEILGRILGSQRVAFGVTTAGANLIGPGSVQAAGEGVISLSAHARISGLSNQLRAAGFIVEYAPDASTLLWGKLVINAAVNPITALLGVTNGELLRREPAHALLVSTAREAAAVAVAGGIRLPYPDPVLAAETIARRTANNRSSMLQDLQRHAPTEIDAICGAIVQAGGQTGVATPINRTLWQLVKARANSKGSSPVG